MADLFITDPRVHAAIEAESPQQWENHQKLFSRKWICPYCARNLRVEYAQRERYLVRCGGCEDRVQYVRADSPHKAAQQVGFALRHVSEWRFSDGQCVWWDSNRPEDPPSYIGTPDDVDFPWYQPPIGETGEISEPQQQLWFAQLPAVSMLKKDEASRECHELGVSEWQE